MQKLHFTKFINAPVEKVWDTMLDDVTYREWTKPFDPGSRYEGSWEEGSTIRFLSAEGAGMLATIVENRPHEFISIKHIGQIKDGVEDTTSEEVQKWAPAFENYTFVAKEGGTELTVDLNIVEEWKQMFEDLWPKALDTLKELSEK